MAPRLIVASLGNRSHSTSPLTSKNTTAFENVKMKLEMLTVPVNFRLITIIFQNMQLLLHCQSSLESDTVVKSYVFSIVIKAFRFISFKQQ